MNQTLKESQAAKRNIPTRKQHRRGLSLTGDENLDLFPGNRRSLSVASSDESDCTNLHPFHCVSLSFFFAAIPYVLCCNACKRRICTDFFRCVECEFNLHVSCVTTLPPTVKDKHHVHPLTLTNSPIKDYPDEDKYSEFYCDSCEKRRELYDPTYYCEECHYVAHVHCQLSEIFPILEEQFLPCKLGETKLEISVCEDGTGIGACKDLMIQEILGTERDQMESEKRFRGPYREVFSDVATDDETEGARTTELDEVEWLTTRLKATKKRLKELEERRAQYVASLPLDSRDNE